MLTQEIDLAVIRQDGGTQTRAFINDTTVDEYAEALQRKKKLPEIIVFYDGSNYWLADGFHRLYAAEKIGWKTYLCEVHQGTCRDAILYSIRANEEHGLRRTPADRRRAVEMMLRDEEWRQWSNAKIAELCDVSDEMVRLARNGKNPSHSENESKNAPIYQKWEDTKKRKVTRKGKTYTQNTANIGKNSKPKPKPLELSSSPEEVNEETRICGSSVDNTEESKPVSVPKENKESDPLILRALESLSIEAHKVLVKYRRSAVFTDEDWQILNECVLEARP